MVLAFFVFFYYDTCTWIILIRNALIFSSSVSDEIHRRKGCVRPGTAVEGMPAVPCAARRKLHMEEMYEVLKFIEHGTHCRRSLDCVQGISLIRHIKMKRRMDRRGMLAWIRDIAICVDQYHRSGSGQDYRYLNPYSIIVTEEEGLRLLDLEAPDNASVIKQMQTGAVRDHFVRPVYELGISRNHEADLFAYGKTIQFMLAYTEVRPALTRLEEMKLRRVISRCTGESGKRYGDFEQVLKALPQIPEAASSKQQGKKQSLKRIAGGVGLGVAACLCLCVLLGVEKKRLVKAEDEVIYQEAAVEKQVEDQGEKLTDTEERMRIRELEQELITEYDRLLESETDPVKAEKIKNKKAEIENNL